MINMSRYGIALTHYLLCFQCIHVYLYMRVFLCVYIQWTVCIQQSRLDISRQWWQQRPILRPADCATEIWPDNLCGALNPSIVSLYRRVDWPRWRCVHPVYHGQVQDCNGWCCVQQLSSRSIFNSDWRHIRRVWRMPIKLQWTWGERCANRLHVQRRLNGPPWWIVHTVCGWNVQG